MCATIARSSCRETKLARDCEALCSKNQRGFISCELRAAVLLPNNTSFDISLYKVMPVLGNYFYRCIEITYFLFLTGLKII